jgi:hypothetical protein
VSIFLVLCLRVPKPIADVKLNIGCSRISISSIGALRRRLVSIDEAGKMIDLPRAREGGCHQGISMLLALFC